MNALTGLIRRTPAAPVAPAPPWAHLPVRRLATTGVAAAASVVAVSAASAATSALRRRAGGR